MARLDGLAQERVVLHELVDGRQQGGAVHLDLDGFRADLLEAAGFAHGAGQVEARGDLRLLEEGFDHRLRLEVLRALLLDLRLDLILGQLHGLRRRGVALLGGHRHGHRAALAGDHRLQHRGRDAQDRELELREVLEVGRAAELDLAVVALDRRHVLPGVHSGALLERLADVGLEELLGRLLRGREPHRRHRAFELHLAGAVGIDRILFVEVEATREGERQKGGQGDGGTAHEASSHKGVRWTGIV
jgi:hypothetical protein